MSDSSSNTVSFKNSSCLPSFLIIGAEKSGTTALWHYLSQHPQIFMSSIKEPQFFAYEGQKINFQGPKPLTEAALPVTKSEDYFTLFQNTSEHHKAIGEASPSYLYSERAPRHIKTYIPGVKLIAVLRNPVDRAHSRFLHLVRDERESITDFSKALHEEQWRIKHNWWPDFYYQQNGFYYQQLLRYFELFDQEQVKVFLYEDLNIDPLKTVTDIFKFLEVDIDFTPNLFLRPNTSGFPQNRALHNLINGLKRIRPMIEPVLPANLKQDILGTVQAIRANNIVKPQLSGNVRQQLVEVFEEDILNLSTLIEKDLSAWLSV